MQKREKKNFEMTMRGVQSRFSRFYARILTAKRLTVSQFSVLIQVVDEGPLKMQDLAKRLYLASSSITHLVDRLEAQKMIQRLEYPGDRRAYFIAATPKGTQLVRQIRKFTIEQMLHRLKGFGEKELQSVLKFMKLLSETLDEFLKKPK
jgi:DNA-binding MarR family transcriptional regulator